MFSFLRNILEVSSCLSISWDKNWFVYGVVFKSGKKLKITAYASCKDESIIFSERLRKVYDELKGNSQDRVILGGCLSNAFTIALDTPSLKLSEINSFLSYELPRHLPCSIEEVIWAFRPIFLGTEQKHKVEKIKVIVISRTLYQKLSEDVTSSKIKFDAITHPYFVTEPLYTGTNLFLDSLNDLFYSNSSEELQGWYMSPVPADKNEFDKLIEERNFLFEIYREYFDEDFDNYIPCIVLAEYGLSQNFNMDKKFGVKIPVECKPTRFRALKVLTIFLALGFSVIFGTYIIREAINNYKILSELKSQKSKLTAEDLSLRKKIIEGKKVDDIIQQVLSSTPDDIDVLDFLEYLTKTVPGEVWLNYLNTYGNSANLTFQSNGNTDKMISDFYKSTNYTLQNSRKNKSGDGIEYIYVNFVKKQKEIQNKGEDL